MFERIESFYLGKREVRDENAKISAFLHTKTFLINLKFFASPHPFCVMPSLDFVPIFPQPTPFSSFSATKITCTFSIYQSLAAASPHYNFDFPQNPILRL